MEKEEFEITVGAVNSKILQNLRKVNSSHLLFSFGFRKQISNYRILDPYSEEVSFVITVPLPPMLFISVLFILLKIKVF